MNIVVNKIIISRAPFVKYLGVYVDEELKWHEHIKNIYNSVKKYIGIFIIVLKNILEYFIK